MQSLWVVHARWRSMGEEAYLQRWVKWLLCCYVCGCFVPYGPVIRQLESTILTIASSVLLYLNYDFLMLRIFIKVFCSDHHSPVLDQLQLGREQVTRSSFRSLRCALFIPTLPTYPVCISGALVCLAYQSYRAVKLRNFLSVERVEDKNKLRTAILDFLCHARSQFLAHPNATLVSR